MCLALGEHGDLGDRGDFGEVEMSKGETDDGSALSKADRNCS